MHYFYESTRQYGVWSRNFWWIAFLKTSFWDLYCVICVLNSFHSSLQCPPALEENDSVTSHDGSASALTAEFLIDLGLDVSTPDTYRPPPAPLPYNLVLGCPQSMDFESARGTIIGSGFGSLTRCEDLDEFESKAQANSLPVSPRKLEVPNVEEPNVTTAEEEDVCPICLEGALPRNWCFCFLYNIFHFSACWK